MEHQRIRSGRTYFRKCQCQVYPHCLNSEESESSIEESYRNTDVDKRRCKDGLYINEMRDCVINIYNQDNTVERKHSAFFENKSNYYNKKSSRRHKSNGNSPKEEKKILLKRKFKNFGKQFLRCIKDRDSSPSASFDCVPIQTMDEIDPQAMSVVTSVSNENPEENRKSNFIEPVHKSGSVFMCSETRKKDTAKENENRAKQCTPGYLDHDNSPFSSTPPSVASQMSKFSCPRDSSEVSHEKDDANTGSADERVKSQTDVVPLRPQCSKPASKENSTDAHKQIRRNCKIIENALSRTDIFSGHLENNNNSDDAGMSTKTNERIFCQNSKRENISAENDVNVETASTTTAEQRKSISRNREGEQCFLCNTKSVLDDKTEDWGVFGDHDEDTMRKETSSNLHLQCESDTEELTYFKLPDPTYQHEETEAKHFIQYVDSSTPELSSGYPWNTSATDCEGHSKDSLPLTNSAKGLGTSFDVPKLSKGETLSKAPYQITPESEIEETVVQIERIQTDCSSPRSEGQGGVSYEQKMGNNESSEIAVCINNEFDPSDDKNTYVQTLKVNAEKLTDVDKCFPRDKLGEKGESDEPSVFENIGCCNKSDLPTEGQECSRNNENPIYKCDCITHECNKSLAHERENIGKTPEIINITEENQNAISTAVFDDKHECQSVPDSQNIGNIKARQRNTSESSDSGFGYESICGSSEIPKKICQTELNSEETVYENEILASDSATDDNANKTPLSLNRKKLNEIVYTLNSTNTAQDKERRISAVSEIRSFTSRNCDKHSYQEELLENTLFDFVPIKSYKCSSLIGMLLNRSDGNNITFIKVSDQGTLQEVQILINVQPARTDRNTKVKMEDISEDDTNRSESKYHVAKDNEGNDKVVITFEDENRDSLSQVTTVESTCDLTDHSFALFSKTAIPGGKSPFLSRKRYFSETSSGEFYLTKGISKSDRQTSGCDVVKEFHSLPSLATDLAIFTAELPSYAYKALSESNLFDITHSAEHGFVRDVKCQWKPALDQSPRQKRNISRTAIESNRVQYPASRTMPLCDHLDGSDAREKECTQFSKTVYPTISRNERKKQVRHKRKRIVPMPETRSSFFHKPTDLTYSDFPLSSTKRQYKQNHKSKNTSLKQDQDKHKRSWKLIHELSWQCRDSGIGTSTYSRHSSTQYVIANHSSCYTKFRSGKMVKERASRKKSLYLVKNRSIFQQQQRLFRQFLNEERRKVAKSVAREIHVIPRTTRHIYGLDSYFNRVNNGTPLTEQERMQYEWLRLASFQNYTGNGNTLALARNGFFHDGTAGPTSTRCYLCNACHSNWEMLDDVNAEHRRQSPNCPFHANSGQVPQNISIASGDNSGSSVRTTASAAISAGSNPTATTAVTSSVVEAAGTETRGSLQRSQTGLDQASSRGGESMPQQPTEDPENEDRSLLALAQPRTQRAPGRTGHSISTIIAPRRNNVATGARSNVGIDPTGNGSSRSGASSQLPGLRLESILGGPVGAGAFSELSISSQTPVSTATEALQGNNAISAARAPTSGTEQAAAGSTDPTSTVVVDNPKHPEYTNIDTRTASYQGFPDYLDQTPRQMSEAGFYFVGVADFTRCFCCGGGLRNWEPGDDPMLEHTRWFPRCEYVNKLKGERYVAAVQRRHKEHMAEQQRQQIELAQRRDENRNPPDPMTTDAAAVMREMGYSVERTREAVLAVRQQTGASVVTTQQVLTWLLDEEDRRSRANTALGIRPPASTISSTPSSVVNTSIRSSVVHAGSSIASSIVYTGTSTRTSIVNTSSSISTATSIVNAGTTTSTVNSTSTASTTSVQQTGTSASAVSTSETGNQQTGEGQTGTMTGTISSSSSSSGGGSVEKQSAASKAEVEQTSNVEKPGGESSKNSNGPKSTATRDTASDELSSKATKKKNAKKKTKIKTGTKSGSAGGEQDAKSLQAENEKLREMQTCKICMEQPVNTTLLPCGHLVCCNSCALRLQRCPICRKRIKGTVKTFMS